jgi:4-aminobutyrate aminotransferase
MGIYFERAEGSWLFDNKGTQYLDGCAGTFNVILGHGNREILNEVNAQMEKIIHFSSSWRSKLVDSFCSELLLLSPKNLDSCFCKVTGGSTANEIAIRLLLRSQEKKKVIFLEGGHHGNTIFLSNENQMDQNKIIAKRPYCLHCPYKMKFENCGMHCAQEMEGMLRKSKKEAACLVVEPIQGKGGNIVPPKGYFKIVSQAAEANDIPIVADEVQTGVGRTGSFFASQLVELKPNVITLAKGLTGCSFPLGAVLYDSEYGKLSSDKDGFTFGANLLSIAAARKTVSIVNDPRFLEEVRQNGDYLIEELNKIKEKSNVIADVRGMGLFIGIEINCEECNLKTDRIVEKFAEKGLLLRRSGNVLKIRPPLNISRKEMAFLLKVLREVLCNMGE